MHGVFFYLSSFPTASRQRVFTHDPSTDGRLACHSLAVKSYDTTVPKKHPCPEKFRKNLQPTNDSGWRSIRARSTAAADGSLAESQAQRPANRQLSCWSPSRKRLAPNSCRNKRSRSGGTSPTACASVQRGAVVRGGYKTASWRRCLGGHRLLLPKAASAGTPPAASPAAAPPRTAAACARTPAGTRGSTCAAAPRRAAASPARLACRPRGAAAACRPRARPGCAKSIAALRPWIRHSTPRAVACQRAPRSTSPCPFRRGLGSRRR